MTIDYVTREQFQIYSQIQEKKEQRDRYEIGNNRLYGWAALNGLAAIIAAGYSILGTGVGIGGIDFTEHTNMSYVFVGGMGVLACVNVLGFFSNIMKITRNSRDMGNLEKEIEALKTQPEYQAVVPSK